MKIDQHGQPINESFNEDRNLEKALSGLAGILSGITSSGNLNEREVLYLDIWLRSQQNIQDDGDLIDIVDLIGDILQDNVITSEELSDLHQLVNDISQYRELPFANEEAKVNQLLGLISGVSSDGSLHDRELQFLQEWLADHQYLDEVWPISVVNRRMRTALADGVIDESERLDLLETFKQLTGDVFEDSSVAHGMATDFLEDPISHIEIENNVFCLTGKFVSGSRKTLEESLTRRGATPVGRVSTKLNYLVIGSLASRDWRFSSHGRKIEKVLELRQKGAAITILTERLWLDLIQK